MPGKPAVTLEAKLDANLKDALVISYVVHNPRVGKIYVFNTLYHTDVQGNRTLDPELAYVVPSENHAVMFGKYLIPIPDGMAVETAEMPYLDPVEAGQALAGKVALRLPLHSFHPYHSDTQTELNLTSNKIVLQIGFLDPARAAPKELLIEPAKGVGTGHFQCDYGLGLNYQELLTQEIAVPKATR